MCNLTTTGRFRLRQLIFYFSEAALDNTHRTIESQSQVKNTGCRVFLFLSLSLFRNTSCFFLWGRVSLSRHPPRRCRCRFLHGFVLVSLDYSPPPETVVNDYARPFSISVAVVYYRRVVAF